MRNSLTRKTPDWPGDLSWLGQNSQLGEYIMKSLATIAALSLAVIGAANADDGKAEANAVIVALNYEELCTTPLPKAVRAMVKVLVVKPEVKAHYAAVTKRLADDVRKGGVGAWCRVMTDVFKKYRE